jgi:hypothetical protein
VAETKEDIAADRDRLAAENDQLAVENDQLKARLQAAMDQAGRTPAVVAPAHRFQLSEGDRQELAARGELNVGGRMRTADEVRGMLGEDQQGVDLGDAEPPAHPDLIRPAGIRGVDYVWPSVAPGEIDPAVAGTPGISGPPAAGE